MPQRLVTKSYCRRAEQAVDAINEDGTEGQGSNKQATYQATYTVTDGYYPGETVHLLVVDLDDEKWLPSMSLTVVTALARRGLAYSSLYRDGFERYHSDDVIEGDMIYSLNDATWLYEYDEVYEPRWSN